MQYSILTVSDKGSAGLRDDLSGETIKVTLSRIGGILLEYEIVPDERRLIAERLLHMCESAHLILTTGGTGFSPRDVTPEATLDIIERQVPGIPEAMRAKSMEVTPRAMLSRAVAGICGKTLIINLPGSPKAVRECLDVILPVLDHAVQILTGAEGECGKG